MQHAVLEIKELNAGYGKKVLLHDVELMVQKGEILTLIGPNGSGKSTLLKSITRQLKTLGGCIYLNSQELTSLSGEAVAKMLSMVMTERPTPELMTCREVAATGRYPYVGALGILSKEDWKKVDEALELVHASEVAGQSFQEISDGQRQRVMLARALCQEPEILVLDEPTSFLDMRYKLDILGSIRDMVRTGRMGVIMSLHELELAMKVSDRIACVDGERISLTGTPEEIFKGDIIQRLYGVEERCFNPLTGALHLPGRDTAEKPEVFVIGGGGYGIPVYHRLQREGVPFAAGILMENDLEADVAKAAATEVVLTEAFVLSGEKELEQAKKLLDSCRECICAVKAFGPCNEGSRQLMEYAREQGKLTGQ